MPPYDDQAGAPAYAGDPWGWVPEHWASSGVAAEATPPPEAPPVEMGPQMPPAQDALAGTMFDAGTAPPPPATAPVPFGAALDASVPPMPYGSDAPSPPPAPPTESAAPFGPPLPPMPTQTPYGWDPLAGSPFEAPHIQPGAEDPFAGVSDSTGYRDAQDLALNHPAAFAQLQADQFRRKQLKASADQIAADEANLGSLKAEQAARQRADAATQAKSDQIVTDAIALSKRPLDRGRWFRNQSTFGKIASVIAAVVGGLATRPGGPNMGLDFVTKHIDDDIADQKADIESERGGLQARQGAVAQEFARTGDLTRAAETVRLATYQATINKLQTEQQNFDPKGTSYLNYGRALQGMQSAAAGAHETMRKTIFDESYKTEQLTQAATVQAEARRHNKAEEALSWAREGRESAAAKAAEGAHDLTNPNYTVPTGFFNPFDKTQPVLGKRAIGGKGEDAKERKEIAAQLDTYTHVQDYWAKLASIGAKIDYHKSLGESAWGKFKSTDAAEYDSAKEALVVYLTKELGDKLTQGQLEAQAHRIPDRANLLESRDPGKQIRDAQEDADRDFSRNMDLVGIDPNPIIKGAQLRRSVATPSANQDLDAAHAAVAADPGSKDARAALDAAEARARDEVETEQRHQSAILEARKLPPAPPALHDEPGRPVEETAAVREANRALHTYGELAKKLELESTGVEHLRGLKQPGDVATANRAHETRLGELAGEVLRARQLAEQLASKAHEEIGRNALADRVNTASLQTAAGIDPLTAGITPSNPPNALAPDRDYLPGADPFAPVTQSVKPAAKHRTKGRH